MAKSFLIIFFSLWMFITSASAQQPALFPIDKNGKSGFIDNTGKVVIPLKFDEARGFSEGLAPVRQGNDWGYIDRNGRFVIKPQFFSASGFSEGFANVGIYWENRRVIDSTVGYDGYIDKSGQIITKDRFGVAFNFSDGLAKISTEDYKPGFIDKTGKIVLFADAWSGFHDGLALFKTHSNMPDSRVGYLDRTGKIAIPATFEYGEDFSEGLACVSSDKGSGFIDTSGKVAIEFKFDGCGSFSDGIASVFVNGLVGFIDKSGKMVIEPNFAFVPGDESHFSDGVAVVKVGESEKPTKDGLRDVTITADRNILSNTTGAFGVIDKTGKFIIPAKYVQLGDFYNGLAWVNLSDAYIIHGDTNRWGYINKQGKIVWKSF